MTQKRLLSIPLLVLVVLSVLAPQARPVNAQTPPPLWSIAVPEWSTEAITGTNVTFSYPNVFEVEITSMEACGAQNDIMGAQMYATGTASNLGISFWFDTTGTFFNYSSGGPLISKNTTGWDESYQFNRGAISNTNPLGVGTPNTDTGDDWIAETGDTNYADKIKLRVSSWGTTGSRTISSYGIVALCSNTGEEPTPTITPECDESSLACKLRHYWPMDELGPTPDRIDQIGGATLQGTNLPGTEYSKYGEGAAQLSTNLFMMTKTEPETLSIAPDGWSISGWFRPQSSGSVQRLAEKPSEYSITTTATNLVSFAAGATTITSTNPVTVDAWHMISVIYDGTEYTLQVDGDSPITSSGSAPALVPGAMFFGNPFSGRLDEWHIWERAITQDQRDQLWNQSEGCFYPWYGGCNPRGLDELLDGGMEQYPESTGWVMNSGLDDFGMRVNRNTLIGWLQFTTIGPSLCGDGYHHLRTDVLSAEDMPISQIFTWAGGDFYWKIATRGQRGIFGSVISPDLQPRAYVTLVDVFSNEEFILIDDQEAEPQTGQWKVNSGVISSLPISNYKMILSSYDAAAVDYDDVAIGTGPIDEACTEKIEPSATPTATATTEPTDIVNPTQMLWTETPGPSPTPSSLLLSNCGFEVANHAGWTLNYQSYINSVGGPIGPYYLLAQGNPAAYQSIFSSSAQTLYFTSYVIGYASIRLVNASTGTVVTVYSAHTSTWSQIKRTANVTAGTWRVELGSSSGYSAAGFDGVDVSKNGYTFSGFCVNTPTPGPTAFVEPTITPSRSPTVAATITATWVTSTPGATRTPYGTPGGSEGPYTSTPNSIQITGTAAWAGTATADAGTIGTYTPAPVPSGTPGGGWNGGDLPPGEGGGGGGDGPTPTMPPEWNPGDPPPASDAAGFWENVPCSGDDCDASQTSWIPGFSLGPPTTGDPPTTWFGGGDGGGYVFHECIKPVNSWSVAWWIDYERCLLFSFFSWGPKQHGLVTGIPQTFTQLEPFGTIAEVNEGIVIMRTQVSVYQYTSGADGVNDTINPGEILNPGSYNPWDEGVNLRLGEAGSGITDGAYTGYCSARLSSEFSGNLSKGVCFAFGVAKNVGLLPWMQFVINILSIVSIIVSAFRIIGVGGALLKYTETESTEKTPNSIEEGE